MVRRVHAWRISRPTLPTLALPPLPQPRATLSRAHGQQFLPERIPILGGGMLAAGMIPIERANRKAAFSSYSVATQRISAGASVTVPPDQPTAAKP